MEMGEREKARSWDVCQGKLSESQTSHLEVESIIRYLHLERVGRNKFATPVIVQENQVHKHGKEQHNVTEDLR